MHLSGAAGIFVCGVAAGEHAEQLQIGILRKQYQWFQLLQFPAAVLVGQITKRFQPLMKMLERAVL